MKNLRIVWLLFVFCVASMIIASSVVAYTATENVVDAKQRHSDHQLAIETIHILGGFTNRMARWSGDIRIAVVGTITASVKIDLENLLFQLSLYTGLNISLVEHKFTDTSQYIEAISYSAPHELMLCSRYDAKDCANFAVVVSSQASMHQIATALPMRAVFQNATAAEPKVHCFFSPSILKFDIQKSVVFIDSSLSESMQKTCLQEEIIQSLGLFNDYTGSLYYSFNNIVSPKQITRHDKMLLASLYDGAHSNGTLSGTVAKQVIDYNHERNLHNQVQPASLID